MFTTNEIMGGKPSCFRGANASTKSGSVADIGMSVMSVPAEKADAQGVTLPPLTSKDGELTTTITETGAGRPSIPLEGRSEVKEDTLALDTNRALEYEAREEPTGACGRTVYEYVGDNSERDNTLLAQAYATPTESDAAKALGEPLHLLARICTLLYQPTDTNIVIKIGDNKFDCQKLILMIYSEFFAKMPILPREVELPQDKCPAYGFQLIYRWMISDETDRIKFFGLEQVVPLWLAAQNLQVMELLRQLWYCFDQLDYINEDVALAIYESALCYGGTASLLQELMLSHITKIFLPLVAAPRSWLELCEQHVFEILTKAYLAVNSEIEIFLAILYWLEYDWPVRIGSTIRLMSTVRFRLFPIWYLTTVKCVDTSRHVHRVLRIAEISKMIETAANDIVSVSFKPSHVVSDSIKITTSQSSKPRCWVVDRQCSYHHKRYCNNFKYPTYGEFKYYLRQVHKRQETYCNSLMTPELAYAESMSCCNEVPSWSISVPQKTVDSQKDEKSKPSLV